MEKKIITNQDPVSETFVCFRCKHVRLFGCDAFPGGIPMEITEEGNEHRAPLPEQGNDIVFEPIDEEE